MIGGLSWERGSCEDDGVSGCVDDGESGAGVCDHSVDMSVCVGSGEGSALGISCSGIVVSLLMKGSARGSESSVLSLKDESSLKYTLSVMMIFHFVGSHNQYAFWPSAYPSMIH